MPYALSNLQDGHPPAWRAVASETDLAEGEVYVEDIPPVTDPVWDEAQERVVSQEEWLAARESGD
jgi:hypothetical protein